LRLFAAASATLAALALLSGCVYTVSEEEEGQRRDNLNAAVDEFDPDSISKVSCDLSGGEIGIETGLTRSFFLAGADSWPAVAERFESLGYHVANPPTSLSAGRPDGILASARLIERPGSQPDMEAELADQGCTVPAEGGVTIQFEEHTEGSEAPH